MPGDLLQQSSSQPVPNRTHREGLELSNFHPHKHLRIMQRRGLLRRGFLSGRVPAPWRTEWVGL
jgi:hypothetical protein